MKPIFITEDGFKLHEYANDFIYMCRLGLNDLLVKNYSHIGAVTKSEFKIFKIRENALRWIQQNNICYSRGEIKKAFDLCNEGYDFDQIKFLTLLNIEPYDKS